MLVILSSTMRPAWGRNRTDLASPAPGQPSEDRLAPQRARPSGKDFRYYCRERTPGESSYGKRIYPVLAAAMHDAVQVTKMVAGENVMAALKLLIEQGPKQAESVIDEDHLGRMTLGDRSLEREVLEIFARQTTLSLEPARGGRASTSRCRRPYAQRIGAGRRSLARGAGGRTAGTSRVRKGR